MKDGEDLHGLQTNDELFRLLFFLKIHKSLFYGGSGLQISNFFAILDTCTVMKKKNDKNVIKIEGRMRPSIKTSNVCIFVVIFELTSYKQSTVSSKPTH